MGAVAATTDPVPTAATTNKALNARALWSGRFLLCARHGAKRQAWRTIVRLKTGAWPTRVDARVKRVGALVLATITGKQKRTGK